MNYRLAEHRAIGVPKEVDRKFVGVLNLFEYDNFILHAFGKDIPFAVAKLFINGAVPMSAKVVGDDNVAVVIQKLGEIFVASGVFHHAVND